MSKANASADEKELGRVFAWEDAQRRLAEKVITQYHWVSRSKVVGKRANPASLGFTAGAGHKSRDFATFIHCGLCEGRVGQVRKAFSRRRLPII